MCDNKPNIESSIAAVESCIAIVKQEMETADLIYENKRDQAIYKSALSNAIVMMIDDIAIQSENCTDDIILKLNMKYL